MAIELYDHQKKALKRMKNGCILCGGVGTGKSRTSLAYYFLQQGGSLEPYHKMTHPKDLYIITTARKRDTLEWDDELVPFLLSKNPEGNFYKNKVVIDSWNNIKKYVNVCNAFFIFDEQRVVGSGEWSKSFIRIAKYNNWILLSATPGDTWTDYIPVFIANGFYRNRTEFMIRHVVYSRYVKWKINKYLETEHLTKLRNSILVPMAFKRKTIPRHVNKTVDYDNILYRMTMKERWNYEKDEPIVNASELCYILRKISNTHESRAEMVQSIVYERKKAIIFYNFDYELEILKSIQYEPGTKISEWNGHKHERIPTGDRWVYLVQYTAGAEGWNCTTTNCIIFYSQNYSYRTMLQASGRIDRLNTPYTNLYYYHLKSKSNIDLAIASALNKKEKFNESAFARRFDNEH